MIDIKIDSKGLNLPNDLDKGLSMLLSDIDLEPYSIKNYTLYVVFNMDDTSLGNVSALDDKQKYILFQNIPSESKYDIGFEAKLTKYRIRLQRYKVLDHIVYRNVVFIFDFLPKDTNLRHSYVSESGAENIDRKKMFVPTDPKYRLDQVIMTDGMREEIEDALSIIRNREKIYEEWGFATIDSQARAVLCFYGPGGTGKTMCAHAVASALGSKILCVNYANIESMWAGESPKNLISAFNVAQESKSVLFMDEADSFLGKRITNVSSGHDQSINSLRSQMLILLEEFDGVVVFGTNLVQNFDKAFETRILKNIKFDLPNENSRVQLFQKMIPSKIPVNSPFTYEDYLSFAKLSEGFSGREIKNTILEVLSRAAKNNVEMLEPQMFKDGIIRHAESINEVKSQTSFRESEIEMAVVDSIIQESTKNYHTALLNLAIYAMSIDGKLDPKEETLISQLAKTFDITDYDVNDIPSLGAICEHFSNDQQKREALDLACKVIAVDCELAVQELDFINRLYCILGYKADKIANLNTYIDAIISANRHYQACFE